MSRLRVIAPDGAVREIVLGPGRTTIGRDGGCTIPVDHPTLSREHAAVEKLEGMWVVLDLGSRNGVRSGGRAVTRVTLKPGDRFQCGKAEFELLSDAPERSEVPHVAPPEAVSAPPVPAEVPASAAPVLPLSPAESLDPGSVTASIPGIGRRGVAAIAIGGLCAGAIAAAVLFMAGPDAGSGGRTARRKETPAKPAPPSVPAPPAVTPPPGVVDPPPPVVEPPGIQDPETPVDGEVRVRLRDGTARVGRILSQDRFQLEIEVRAAEGRAREVWPLEQVLRIGDQTVRPDWKAIFARKFEEAGDDREKLLALEQWCRKYGYAAGQRETLAALSRKPEAPDVAPAARKVRFQGLEYDAQELRAAGKLDARGRLVMAPDDLRYLRDVSFDLLGRAPTTDEIQLAASETRAQTVDRLTRSPEAWETWYDEELYYFLLLDNFRPATARLTTIPQKLAAGTLTLPDAMHEIVISQYFNHRNPGNDTFVTVVLEQLLGMVVQDQPMLLATGKKMYDGYEGKLFGEPGSSQADLVSIVLRQRAFYERVLARQHRRLTGTEIPPALLAMHAERVMADGAAFPTVMKEWLLDDGYIARASKLRMKSDHQFIRSLYVELLGRRATQDEFRLFRNALQALADPGPIRSVLAKVLVDSKELKLEAVKDPKVWVSDLFVRMLGRQPTEKELEVFGKAVAEGKERLAVQAIVDSLEYQGY